MTKIATFSNGTTDAYNGHRDVTAAWAIIRKSDGSLIASGHSLDRDRAAGTAAGNLPYVCHGYGPLLPTRAYPGIEKTLRRCGYTGPRSTAAMTAWAREQNAARRALIEADHTVEIINL
ncbi:MAG: hypothetical protein LC676_10830 [Loktanella sp.]|nr:hypothetical protein [Loktanella sp.]